MLIKLNFESKYNMDNISTTTEKASHPIVDQIIDNSQNDQTTIYDINPENLENFREQVDIRAEEEGLEKLKDAPTFAKLRALRFKMLDKKYREDQARQRADTVTVKNNSKVGKLGVMIYKMKMLPKGVLIHYFIRIVLLLFSVSSVAAIFLKQNKVVVLSNWEKGQEWGEFTELDGYVDSMRCGDYRNNFESGKNCSFEVTRCFYVDLGAYSPFETPNRMKFQKSQNSPSPS